MIAASIAAGSAMAGKPVPDALLIDVDEVIDACYAIHPDPGLLAERVVFGTSGHRVLVDRLGASAYARVESPATAAEKIILANLGAEHIRASTLAGAPIVAILTRAPGNGASIGGVEVTTPQGWIAVRPSGTEDLYKLYAESFRGAEYLQGTMREAQRLMADALVVGRSTKPSEIEARP